MSEEIIAIPMNSPNIPQSQRTDRADFVDKLKPEAAVEVLRHRFMGEQFKDGEWVLIPELKDKRFTPEGAWELANLMLAVSTINLTISKLNNASINTRLKNLAKTAQKMLVGNFRNYGLKSTSQQWYVHQIIFSNSLGVLKQADEGGLQDLFKTTINENRNINTEKKPEGKIRRMLGL
jgi:hypothetical protein